MSADAASNVEYVTARVRARRATLFDDDDYRKLVRMGTGEIARFMEETNYDREMNELGARHSGVDLIEYALNANLARHFDDLLRWAEGRIYEQIARYLRKFDAWNIKTILRGRYVGADRDDIEEDLIRAGELSDHQFEALLSAGSIEDLIEHLADTRYGPALAEAFPDYEETELLVPLENAVDRAYYENLIAGLEAGESRAMDLYLEFLQAEIDFINARNALRIAHSGANIAVGDYYIEGGRLFDESELTGLSDSPADLIAHIRSGPYGEQLTEALEALEAGEPLSAFERALDVALIEYSHHLSNVYPLSVCPVLAFVLAKEREVENIRAVARGREAGLDPEEIEADLVIR